MGFRAAVDNEIYERVARWLAERSVENFELRREGDVVKVIVDDEVMAKVKIVTIGRGTVFHVYGSFVDEEGGKAVELTRKMEKGVAKPYQIRALLATDGSYKAKEKELLAATTSVVQAALYRHIGFEVYYAGWGNLTRDGLKPMLIARQEGAGVIEMIRKDLENAVRALNDRERRVDLFTETLALLGRVEISIKGAYGEEGRRKATEVKRVIMERIEMFARLRLGEDGKVCLAGCRFGEPTLIYKHEVYARFIAPLIYYVTHDTSEEEIAKFLTYLILYDGSVGQKVYLVFGHFNTNGKRLPLDIYDKIALFLIFAKKYNIEIKRIYLKDNIIRIQFNNDYIAKVFTTAWDEFSALLRWSEEQRIKYHVIHKDHIFKKLRRMLLYVERLKGKSNVVELAGVKLNVEPKNTLITIVSYPISPEAFDRAVKALKEAGFVENVHFTARRPENGKHGYIYIKIPVGLWKLAELSKEGIEWAKKAIDRLREIARERGFSDLLEEYLKPVLEIETLDPKKVAVEDPEKDIRVVIRDLRHEWVNGRPKIVVEYEVNGRVESFHFAWYTATGGRIQASVKLDVVKALVLATLTSDESLKRKRGPVTLSAKHFLAIARFVGVGWELFKWYMAYRTRGTSFFSHQPLKLKLLQLRKSASSSTPPALRRAWPSRLGGSV